MSYTVEDLKREIETACAAQLEARCAFTDALTGAIAKAVTGGLSPADAAAVILPALDRMGRAAANHCRVESIMRGTVKW